MFRRIMAVVVAFAGLVPAATAWAQDETLVEYVPEGEISEWDVERDGFDATLQLSANVNLVSNKSVVGQTDGLSTLLGLSLLGGLDYGSGRHEWLNTFQVNEAWTRTPVLPEFVKSDDLASIESLYHYFLISWAGLFGQAEASTSLLRTWANTTDPVDYQISQRDGTIELREDVERLRLADPFQPLTLNQSLGVFAEPVQEKPLSLMMRVGFGLRETFANGVLVIQDDETTEVIEVEDLTNPDSTITVFQGGLEGFLGVSGQLMEDRLVYSVGLGALLPFLNNDSQDRTAVELTRVGLAAGVGYGVFDWMSINYKLRILQDPQLLDDLQVQNNLLLTFNYTLLAEEPEETAEPSELSEAEERVAAAEARAAELEAQNAELQQQLAAERANPAPSPTSPNPAPLPDAPPEAPAEP